MTIKSWTPADQYPFSPERPAIVEFQCFHCHKTTRVVAKRVADEEAAHWRGRYEKLLAMLRDGEVGDDALDAACEQYEKHESGEPPSREAMRSAIEAAVERMQNP